MFRSAAVPVVIASMLSLNAFAGEKPKFSLTEEIKVDKEKLSVLVESTKASKMNPLGKEIKSLKITKSCKGKIDNPKGWKVLRCIDTDQRETPIFAIPGNFDEKKVNEDANDASSAVNKVLGIVPGKKRQASDLCNGESMPWGTVYKCTSQPTAMQLTSTNYYVLDKKKKLNVKVGPVSDLINISFSRN